MGEKRREKREERLGRQGSVCLGQTSVIPFGLGRAKGVCLASHVELLFSWSHTISNSKIPIVSLPFVHSFPTSKRMSSTLLNKLENLKQEIKTIQDQLESVSAPLILTRSTRSEKIQRTGHSPQFLFSCPTPTNAITMTAAKMLKKCQPKTTLFLLSPRPP